MASRQQCDGYTRRDCLRVGAIGATGLSLGGILRMSRAGMVQPSTRNKFAIFIELPGGPSHIDSFDPKPEGPTDIRGKFSAIPTKIAGVRFSGHLPKLAAVNDRFSLLRGVSHSLGAHPLGQKFINSGNRPTPALDYPGYGSVAARQLTTKDDLPVYVAVPRASQGPGYLGVKFAPLATNETPRAGWPFNVRGITLGNGITVGEIGKRKNLLDDLDKTFSTIEKNNELLDGLDEFGKKAFQMITSRSAREGTLIRELLE